VIAITLLSIIPGHWQVRTPLPPHVEHFIAYCGTGIILALASRTAAGALRGASFLIAYSAIMEILQHFSPGRDPILGDVIAGGSGAVVGALKGPWLITLVRASAHPRR
jgi:VanZ family protein